MLSFTKVMLAKNLRDVLKQTKDFVGNVVNGEPIIPQGIIHVGGNIGEEAEIYNNIGIQNVVWIEAVQESFQKLSENVSDYPHICINALITDLDDQKTKFYKNRVGKRIHDHSYSSIYPINREIESLIPYYRVVQTLEEIELISVTLPTCLERHGLKKNDYDFLSMNAQGSELLIVKGMGEYLKQMKWVQSEVNSLSEVSIYEGENSALELQDYMKKYGFSLYPIKHCCGNFVLYLNNEIG